MFFYIYFFLISLTIIIDRPEAFAAQPLPRHITWFPKIYKKAPNQLTFPTSSNCLIPLEFFIAFESSRNFILHLNLLTSRVFVELSQIDNCKEYQFTWYYARALNNLRQHILEHLTWMKILNPAQDSVRNQNARRILIQDTSSNPVSNVGNATSMQSRKNGSATRKTKNHWKDDGSQLAHQKWLK